MSGRILGLSFGVALALLAACDEDVAVPHDGGSIDAGPPPARHVRMDFAATDFFAAPFPSEHRRQPDGTIDLARAPRAHGISLQILGALDGERDFATTAPIHFALDGALDPSHLPSGAASLETESAIALLDVDPASPERGRRRSFDSFYEDDGGPFGAPHFLTVLPTQGIPLRPNTRYAVVLTRRLRSADGVPLEPSEALVALQDGRVPDGLSASALADYRSALTALEGTLAPSDVVALTVFRTGDPTAVLRQAVETSRDRFAPSEVAPLALTDVFDTYCVYEGRVRMPVFQAGEPPYSTDGGAWVVDAAGVPQLQREEEARLWVTVPRTTMPTEGFPTVVMVRTGAGGDRPLVDRGVRDGDGDVLVPGTGPALEFARAGFAGVSIDGPHGGLRNVTGGDEQFLVFNIQNPPALRDNLRQSALELVLLARALPSLRVDATSCPGLETTSGTATLDAARVALFGHSMGASIAPLAAAFEPRFGALVLSGAGGSWIENIVYKERPLATRPLAETLLAYPRLGRTLTRFDPMLGLLQWAGEAADAQVYAPLLAHSSAPRHVLMLQGIVDHYIMPPIANALSLALGADLGGTPLDATTPELAPFLPLAVQLPLRERSVLPLPIEGNVTTETGAVTIVVTQHREDGVEDGHEIAFQTDAPKAQYRCFLRTFAANGSPRVPGLDDPCAE